MPILIGRGLDPRKTKESVSLLVNSDLCSFEGAGRGSEESGECAKRKRRAKRSGQEARSAPGKVSGDDSWRAPPVPIPNTEVKPPNADGTELGTAWESRKLPGSKGEREERKFFPLSNIREQHKGREKEKIFLSSSMAEHSAVNRRVVSSSLT